LTPLEFWLQIICYRPAAAIHTQLTSFAEDVVKYVTLNCSSKREAAPVL